MNYLNFVFFFILIKVTSQIFSCGYLPRLVVFELDYVLWPFWVDVDLKAPFHKKNGIVIDSDGIEVRPYEESTKVLSYLHNHSIKIGIYSKTLTNDSTHQLFKLFGWDRLIDTIYLVRAHKRLRKYRGDIKPIDLKKISDMTGFNLYEILLIENSNKNNFPYTDLEVVSYAVEKGVNMKNVKEAFRLFSDIKETEAFEAEYDDSKENEVT